MQNIYNTNAGLIDVSRLRGNDSKPSIDSAFMFMEKEIWLPITGFEGLYEVSNTGFIKCVEKTVYDGHPSRPEKVLKIILTKKGYVQASLWAGNVAKTVRVHRVVASHFVLNPHNKPTVNHIDGNKQNNAAYNLEWATNKEQSEHAMGAGLMTHRGSGFHNTKLTENVVIEIRKLYESGDVTQKEVAEKYGITEGCCNHIIRRTTWNHC